MDFKEVKITTSIFKATLTLLSYDKKREVAKWKVTSQRIDSADTRESTYFMHESIMIHLDGAELEEGIEDSIRFHINIIPISLIRQ